MTPRIFKSGGAWVLRFPYHPRSFTLFGASREERERIFKYSVQDEVCKSWEGCVSTLRDLYKRGDVRRHS